MSGSAGFLSMEVKLDLDNAEKGIRDLARFARAELGKPIKIDDASFKAMAGTLASLEGSYADTLEIVQRMNASTANLARSTRAVADAAKYAAKEQGASTQALKDQERTQREVLALERERVKAAGAVAAAEAKAAGTLAYGAQQQQMVRDRAALANQARDEAAAQKASAALIANEQRSAAAAIRAVKSEQLAVSRLIAQTEKEITKEQERSVVAAVAEYEALKKVSSLRAGLKTATSGVDWGVTAVGAAQARNYGYAVGALINMGRAAGTSLAGMSAAATASAASIAAVAVAAVGATVAVGALSVKVASFGSREAVGLESLAVQMNALMPTARMARQELEGLFTLGTQTIAPTSALIELDKRLLLAGGSAAQMRQQVVEGFAGFTTAVGASQEQMNALNYLIGEVTLKGRLMRTEMSQQFATAGIGQAEFLKATADATGESVDALNAKLTEGTFTSDMFVQGIIAYFQNFSAGADSALTTVSARVQNLGDAIRASIGKAFYDVGVTSALSNLIGGVARMAQSVIPYFSLIGQRVNEFVSTVTSGLSAIGTSGGGSMLATLFGQIIPGAIGFATQAVGVFLNVAAIIAPIIRIGVQTTLAFAQVLGSVLGPIVKSLIPVFAVAAGVIAAFAATLRIAVGLVQGAAIAISALLRGDWSGALYGGIGAVAAGFKDAAAMAVGFKNAVTGIKLDKSLTKGPAAFPDAGRESPAGARPNDAGKGGGGAGGAKKATQAARDLASALASLYDQTRRWLGQRSEIEQSLMGGLEGFTASADAIIDAGIAIVKTLDKAGYSGKSKLVTGLKREVIALAKLAQQRDRLQKVLEEQQESLRGLQSDRSSMSASVAQSLNDFVWALQTESETIQNYTRLDAVGSFVIEQRKVSKSWVASLRERLEATRKFISNIRALKSKGLNADTIRQLVEAGPEAAAAAVAELSAGGAETISEVNAIQREMLDLSSSFGEEQAGNYFDAGIAAAQALVAGTEAALSAIAGQASNIAESIRAKLAAIAKPAADAGAETGAAYGGALKGAIDSSLAGYSPPSLALPGWSGGGEGMDLGGMLGDQDYAALGEGIVQGLFDGIKNKLLSAWTWVSGLWNTYIVQPFKDFFEISSPSGLFLRYGGDIVQGLINGILGLLTNNPVVNIFRNAFSAAITWLTVTLPNEVGAAGSAIWGKLATGFPDVAAWAKGKWATVTTWLDVTLPKDVGGFASGIWSQLRTSFPDVLTWVQDKWDSTIDWLRGRGRYAGGGLPGAVRSAVNALDNAISFSTLTSGAKDAMKSGINSILRSWNALRITFPAWSFSVLGKNMRVGGWTVDTPNIPLLAAGGVTTRPTLAGIGERGREAVLPLTNPRAMSQIADAIAHSGGPTAAPQVRVFIGERELTDIVRVEMRSADSQRAAKVYAGRGL